LILLLPTQTPCPEDFCIHQLVLFFSAMPPHIGQSSQLLTNAKRRKCSVSSSASDAKHGGSATINSGKHRIQRYKPKKAMRCFHISTPSILALPPQPKKPRRALLPGSAISQAFQLRRIP